MPGQQNQGSAPRYKIAYGSVPKDGGTFTFYRNLRPALLKHDIELICVSVGQHQASLVEPAYRDDGCILLAADCSDVREQARAFVQWCEEQHVDIVMAINSIAILSALPHLPTRIRVVARCANAFDEGYRVTLSGRDRLARIVALTPRLRDDLVNDYSVPPASITLIPNGIDPGPYNALAHGTHMDAGRTAGEPPARTLELGFLGRLEHTQKGVLYLPDILRKLDSEGVSFRLRIAGKGKHEQQLRKRLEPWTSTGKVEFTGSLAASEVPAFLASLDVFLFTSHFEGCPNTLLEAMMAGAATVAFQIEGILDFIVDHNRTGLVAPAGDCETFAAHVAELAGNADMRLALGQAAALEARQRFTPDVAANQYAAVFDEVMAKPPPAVTPRAWSQFSIDPVYDPGWKALVPGTIKHIARRLRTRLTHQV